jgi:DHA2 family multidrug resistance protein
MAAVPGNAADNHYFALAHLYAAMQRQASLLAYMDQFKLLGGVMLCMVPLVFFLKRPPAQKHIELDAH